MIFYIIIVLVNNTSWLLGVENNEIDVLVNQRSVGLANFNPNI